MALSSTSVGANRRRGFVFPRPTIHFSIPKKSRFRVHRRGRGIWVATSFAPRPRFGILKSRDFVFRTHRSFLLSEKLQFRVLKSCGFVQARTWNPGCYQLRSRKNEGSTGPTPCPSLPLRLRNSRTFLRFLYPMPCTLYKGTSLI